MTEADIVTQFNLVTDRTYVIMQWWVSVSFALIALAHFSGKKLNLVLVLTLSALYVLLTIFIAAQNARNMAFQSGLREDLAAIQASGEVSNYAAVIMSDFSPLADFAIRFAIIGLFWGSLLYLFFSYRKAQSRKP